MDLDSVGSRRVLRHISKTTKEQAGLLTSTFACLQLDKHVLTFIAKS